MLPCFTSRHVKSIIPIQLVAQNDYQEWFKKQDNFTRQWLTSNQFRGEAGCFSLIPDSTGTIQKVICIVPDKKSMWSIGNLPLALPEGIYELDVKKTDHEHYAISWGLGSYQFTRYKKSLRKPAQLYLSADVPANYVNNVTESIYWVRDLINLPTNDLGPSEFSKLILEFSKNYRMTFKEIVGEDLLKQNYPAIHAVGRACHDESRLIDLRWGNKKHPKITLVGKGVCFDTGGLDLKPSPMMLLMKKDMGGAAHVLGLARMIMESKLPICLRVLIPLVENAVGGDAYRPGDVINSRKGLTIEIGNTDAEGRLILADALTEAVSEKPELIIDMATLTGAARVALGPDLPALFSNQDNLAQSIIRHGLQEQDPVWHMPLFSAYREALNSVIADINNVSVDSYGGAITAALFLKEFVPDEIAWIHFDLMAWNLRSRAGRPQGGEAMALRALLSYLTEKYSN